MPRRLTGFTPSGNLHLGNYLGAIRPIIAEQRTTETVVFISDLHALTLHHDPAEVRERTMEFAALLLAAGLDPNESLFMVQSHVPEHTELHYLLECVTGYGEAQRMIQFKEKARRPQQVRTSLLTYPILMAADILLYDADEVPVGEDQRQHVELARDLANRFNARYGHTFTVPQAVNPSVAARVMDLCSPAEKMSKSTPSVKGVLRLLDEPNQLRRKIMGAVTDAGTDVVYDPDQAPGVANLLDILAACTGTQPQRLAIQFDRYGELKQAVADAVLDTLTPIRERFLRLVTESEHVRSVLLAGADQARQQAGEKVRQAKTAIGLLQI
jgi:tryptophanyl-tRNA synthetase